MTKIEITMRLFLSALVLAATTATAFAAPPRQTLVITPLRGAGRAVAELYEAQKDGRWAMTMKTSAFIGKNGVTQAKKDGDGCTPVGAFALDRPFGFAPNPGTKLPYRQVTSADVWVTDTGSQFYNRWVDRSRVPVTWSKVRNISLEKKSCRLAAVIEYNTEPVVRGAGCALFLQVSDGKGTDGSVSVAEDILAVILRRIEKDALIVIRNAVK